MLARFCMAGLADVWMELAAADENPLPQICVRTDNPLAACMYGQYAGWPIACGKWFAMGSGPGRVHRGREELFHRYPVTDPSESRWIVLETGRLPDSAAVRQMAAECGCRERDLVLCAARTASLSGTVQIVARSVESAMHKLLELGFDLRKVRGAAGTCPLPPVGSDDLQSIGWTNDSILLGGRVWMYVEASDGEIESVVDRIPSSASPDSGRPFREIFERYNRDFYSIDRMLFGPAEVMMTSLVSGRVFRAGGTRPDLLAESYGMGSGAASRGG